jgi:hypothetical protein
MTEVAEENAVPSSSWAKASFMVKVCNDSFLLIGILNIDGLYKLYTVSGFVSVGEQE